MELKDRNEYLLAQCMKYFRELLWEDEQYCILNETIGLTDDEISAFGFDLEIIKKYH